MLIAAAMLMTACLAEAPAGTAGCDPPGTQWRAQATEDDRRRLREWREAWLDAVGQAREAGHGAEVAEEGPLLEPDAALADPMPAPGDYACRTVKVGSPRENGLAFVRYPPFRCRIATDQGRVTFAKTTGSQRPIGRLFADTGRHLVFLGTMQLGDERDAYRYGVDRERDVAGRLERIGEARWRLAFPLPHFESLLDVIELVPIENENGGSR